ncbi:putative diphthamide synthesis protein-domain-containing protein [Haematococcus lacustris]
MQEGWEVVLALPQPAPHCIILGATEAAWTSGTPTQPSPPQGHQQRGELGQQQQVLRTSQREQERVSSQQQEGREADDQQQQCQGEQKVEPPPSPGGVCLAGYRWQLPGGLPPSQCVYVWVGPPSTPTLQALQLALSTEAWLAYFTPEGSSASSSKAQISSNAHGGTGSSEDIRSSTASQEPGGGGGGGDGGGASDGGKRDAACSGAGTGSGVGEGCVAAGVSAAAQCVQEGLDTATRALLKRRYFLVEKAREASLVGILVGTTASPGLAQAMAALRHLIKAAGKRSYTMLVGKPNPAKLANFPEIEVWVHLADPSAAILDSKPFLAPLITPYEALLALAPPLAIGQQPPPHQLGLQPLLDLVSPQGRRAAGAQPLGRGAHTDPAAGRQGSGAAGNAGACQGSSCCDAGAGAGAATGSGSEGWTLQVAGGGDEQGGEGEGRLLAVAGLQLSCVSGSGGRQVKARDAAGYLTQHRTFQGLEAPVAGAAPKLAAAAVEGQRGRAAVYSAEPGSRAVGSGATSS